MNILKVKYSSRPSIDVKRGRDLNLCINHDKPRGVACAEACESGCTQQGGAAGAIAFPAPENKGKSVSILPPLSWNTAGVPKHQR